MELMENERIDDLEFNNLKIIQDINGFCFGIDSILLSDYAKDLRIGANVIDIGTGNGIIGILLCEKSRLSHITGIEIQREASDIAKRNVELNNFQNKFDILNINIKDVFNFIKPNSIDAIVTNPPYMEIGTGVRSSELKKLIARHEIECNLEDIVNISYKLLKSKAEFYMIHRAERIVDIMYTLRKFRLEPKKLRFVQSKTNVPPNLVLIKSVKDGGKHLKIEPPLIIYNNDGTYTDEIYKIYNKRRRYNK